MPKSSPEKSKSITRTIRDLLKSNPATARYGTQRAFAEKTGISYEALQLLEYGRIRLSDRLAKLIEKSFFIDAKWLLRAGPDEIPLASDGKAWTANYFLQRADRPEAQQKGNLSVRGIEIGDFAARYSRLVETAIRHLTELGRLESADLLSEAMVRIMEETFRTLEIPFDVWSTIRMTDEDRMTSDPGKKRLEPSKGNVGLNFLQRTVGSSLAELLEEKTCSASARSDKGSL